MKKLTNKEKTKFNSKAHRQALIDEGLYSIPTHKIHKNKTKYTRKEKHKKRGELE